jgi:hypothetical protein
MIAAVRNTTEPSPQSLVDALSVAVGRAVLLDDPALVPLAYSRQWEFDTVRSESILGRGPSAAVRDALLRQGIGNARDLVRTSPDPALEMEARVCMPVRDGDVVLGYLWLLDPDQDLGASELDRVRQAAGELASALDTSRSRQVADEAHLVDSLRSPDPAVRDAAATEVRERALLPDEGLVLCLLTSRGPAADPVEAARSAVRRLSLGDAIAGTQPVGAVVIASLRDPVLRTLGEAGIGSWLRAVSGADIAVGQSAAVRLTELGEAFRQSSLALRVAVSRSDDRAVAAWPELGADRLIAQLPEAALADVPEGLAHLLGKEPGLVATLTAFLEAGGEIKSTAAALSLHRSGLYYRLRRIEELSGLDLGKGDDRLLAHLAIRAEQMR